MLQSEVCPSGNLGKRRFSGRVGPEVSSLAEGEMLIRGEEVKARLVHFKGNLSSEMEVG